jgi:chemotaxis protein CheY-P-specific phosphatase CheC
MEFSKEVLQKVVDIGSKGVSDAFSKLSGEKVEVTTSAAELLSYKSIGEGLLPTEKASIVSYAQLIDGVEGASILSIPREDTLILVDLLNKKEVGTTGILMDFDRSAIKETLNILSNSYLNALTKIADRSLIIGAPYMMTAKNVSNVIEKIGDGEEKAIVFTTVLKIASYKINAQLFLIFDQEFVDLIKVNK